MSDQERPPEYMTNQDIVRSFEATKHMYNDIMLQLGVLKGHVESQASSTSASILFITQRLRALEKTKGEHSGLSDEMLEQKFESMTSLEISHYMTDLQNELDQADALYSRALDRMRLALAIKTRKGAEPK